MLRHKPGSRSVQTAAERGVLCEEVVVCRLGLLGLVEPLFRVEVLRLFEAPAQFHPDEACQYFSMQGILRSVFLLQHASLLFREQQAGADDVERHIARLRLPGGVAGGLPRHLQAFFDEVEGRSGILQKGSHRRTGLADELADLLARLSHKVEVFTQPDPFLVGGINRYREVGITGLTQR